MGYYTQKQYGPHDRHIVTCAVTMCVVLCVFSRRVTHRLRSMNFIGFGNLLNCTSKVLNNKFKTKIKKEKKNQYIIFHYIRNLYNNIKYSI